MSRSILIGSTSVVAAVSLRAADGTAVTDVAWSTTSTKIWVQVGNAAAVEYTPVTGMAAGTFVAFGLYHAGNGRYKIGLPDSLWTAASQDQITVWIATPSAECIEDILTCTAAPSSGSGSHPASPTFTGITATGSQITIDVKERDDYSAADGRAFTWTVTQPGINFADATVTTGSAGGRAASISGDEIAATMTLHDQADGSCTVQIEFTSLQLKVPPQTYHFDAHILVDGRRVTTTEITLNVLPKYADAA